MTGQAAADLSAMVRAARGGNEAAFRQLYREVQPGLLRYLRGLVPAQDAEDIASETWLQIARDIRGFRDEGAGFRGWAATIARHRALDHIRRMQRRPVAGLTADVLVDLPDRTDTAEQAITHTMTNATVEAMMQSASGRELTMTYAGGSAKIVVPESASVSTLVAGTRDQLVVGAPVNLTHDASGMALRIQVGPKR